MMFDDDQIVADCPLAFSKVIDTKWQKRNRRKGYWLLRDIPSDENDSEIDVDVEDFEAAAQQVKIEENSYSTVNEFLVKKTFTLEKGKVYQFCHLSSCEASLTTMKLCLDTILRSYVDGTDTRVLFVDPKEKLWFETAEEFADELIWLQDSEMDTEEFLVRR
ncbi:Oidioi.mRNA.OKI2018_I69.XSR.g15144.t1.cds [Oikopleura dioica]|uniref:Oidioi.mRNA.OKI2018_I69.XSR.g15144.t1.cds n=1 Tax=Oikopleura dioica TaxID=34765 RepID=A0ABN7SBX5_OIKDI|nr:Oidioi.mRNA.OKI2018_I69.XSR.g15144.t1.cds [Oikopleura dioica]